MPQVDKVTFLPIVFWTALLYICGYVLFSLSFFFNLFTSIKLITKRCIAAYKTCAVSRTEVTALVLFPWVTL